ncbi:hypothetical protein BY458DRAFT_588779 [Sporodiniella umbellata]|nr:hypothetical protein BY458DRAFT_588779 [Sporodiniella umbellata]
MDHDTLEQQTAPESTRGLFDLPETPRNSDRRRTFQGLPNPVGKSNRPQAVSMLPPARRHQRSRSEINSEGGMNGKQRRSFMGLDTLREEIHSGGNIKDVINTLKTLPPITPPLSSKSLEKQTSDEHLDMSSREAALAEAEAKLMGTFSKRTDKKRTSLQQLPVLTENGEAFMEPSQPKRSIVNSKSLSLSLSSSNKQTNRRSRNFDDWRNSTPAAGSNRASFSLVPFTPTRVNFSRDDANPHQRRPLFIAHLPFSSLSPLFRRRELVKGMMRVNKRNRSDAYVACDELDGSDIYICGSRDRNRALEGDVVAVRLVNVERVLREKQEKEDAKLARNNGQVKVRLPDEEDENEIVFGGDEEIDVVKPKYAGVVVAILERAQNQVFSGTLTLSRPNNKRAQLQEEEGGDKGKKDAPRIVWFKATDKRVPLIAIPIEQVPEDFVDNTEAYANRLFVGSIKRWPITSLHPFGTLERELGAITDLDIQVKAILADANVTDTPFSEAVMECVPPSPFLFTPSVEEGRRDLTLEEHGRMVTIDPVGSTLFEDGLSIVRLGDDTFEVGVHVCDVSYFIKPHSPLDKEARARGVQVHLDFKDVPMLPAELIQAANFNVDELKPAVSVIWKMDKEGVLLDTWFGKTTVRSVAQLSYNDVEKIINGEQEEKEVEKDIRQLYRLASELHNKRYTSQAMGLARQLLAFDDPVKPSEVTISNKNPEVAKLTKEFLFLANRCVAHKISSQYPEQALLRRQAAPDNRKIIELREYANNYLNVDLDVADASTLQASVEKIEDAELRQLVSVLVLKTMKPPKYFCAGAFDISKYSHFSVGTPLFTHFTAPLRRYVDVIVHRQLEAALLNLEKHFYLPSDTIQKLAQHSNVKREASIDANQQAKLLSLALYLNGKQPSTDSNVTTVYGKARVIAVMEDWFDVSLPEFGMERRIHLCNLPLLSHKYESGTRALTMYWKEGVLPSTGEQQALSLSDDEYEEEEWLLSEPDKSQNAFKDLGPGQPKKSASKRASIISSRLSASTGYSSEQCSQTIKALDKIGVMLTIQMVRTPPLIRVFAANPYA